MKKKLTLGLAMAVASSMALAGCGSNNSTTTSGSNSTATESTTTETTGGTTEATPTTSGVEQTLRFNLGADPLTLDPQLNSAVDGSHIINNTFEGLMRERNGEIVEAAAESYTVSEDGLVYTFTIRDAVWTDGQPVTAGDFEFAWKRGANPATASEYMFIFESANIVNATEIGKGEVDPSELGVKALDDKTLEVTLTRPTDYFLGLTGFAIFMPVREDVVDDDGIWSKDASKVVSNGPFTLSEYKMGDQLTLVKNDTYWNAENVSLEKIICYMIVDESTAHTRYLAGELDINEHIPSGEVPTLIAEDPTFYIIPKIGTYYFAFNMNNPALEDVRVRKALSLAINRDLIVKEVTRGGQIAATSFMPLGISDANGESFNKNAGDFGIDVKGDPETARALLAEAGFPGGEGLGTIEILYNTSESHKMIAEAVQEMWKVELGIDVVLTNQEWAVFQETTNNNAFDDLARRSWIGDYNDPQTMLEIFESVNGQNIGRYNSEAFDAEMAASRETMDAERMEHLYKAHEVLMEDVACIPIYYYVTNMMFADSVEGWELTDTAKLWFGDTQMVAVED